MKEKARDFSRAFASPTLSDLEIHSISGAGVFHHPSHSDVVQ
jgi:hypothetical protein